MSRTGDARDPELSPVRTLALGAILAIVLFAAIAVICMACALVGTLAMNAGLVSFEDMTSPTAIISVAVAASVVLALILCAAISRTLVSPLRRMTLAMGRLAEGDFTYRLPEGGRFDLREVDAFARSYNVAAAELAGTEMMRAGFISDFSHEFRTPINSLSGFAQLLLDDDVTPEERREYAGIIVDESARLAGLSERILLLSKMEATAILPDTGTVDIAEQIRRTVLLLEPKLQAADISVGLALDSATVRGNGDHLAQLWLNLLDNAVKFSPRGGRVEVALYGGRPQEEGRDATADMVAVWVSDEGCGMDTDTLAHIFDRFYQGDSSHASKGSGLGLTLCRRIVELHGGTIEVQSAPGKGSVFEVRLPLAAREDAATGPAASGPSRRSR